MVLKKPLLQAPLTWLQYVHVHKKSQKIIFELRDIEMRIPGQELSQLHKGWAQKAQFAKAVQCDNFVMCG